MELATDRDNAKLMPLMYQDENFNMLDQGNHLIRNDEFSAIGIDNCRRGFCVSRWNRK
jgi:hypothetical protein